MTYVNTYPVGATVRLSATFTDLNGFLVDPSGVQVLLGPPTGSPVTFTAIRDSLGLFHYDWLSTGPGGLWYYRFVATGAVATTSFDTPFKIAIPAF